MFSHIGSNFVNLTADSVTAVDWQTGRLKTGSQVISQTAAGNVTIVTLIHLKMQWRKANKTKPSDSK